MLKLPGMKSLLVAPLFALVRATGEASSLDQYVDKLASLVDPARLATRGARGANSRVPKAVAILAEAETQKIDVAQNPFLPAALILAQRAFAMATSRARPAALSFPLLAGPWAATALALPGFAPALTFAQ